MQGNSRRGAFVKYLSRLAEAKTRQHAQLFKVVLVTGARQVGKSTLLKHLFPEHKAIVFDPIQDLHGARKDPDLFLDSFPAPIILDEIQYAPELLPALKRRVDLSSDSGQYLLTGSQNPGLLKTVAETLAGRVGIVDLAPMTYWELEEMPGNTCWLPHFLKDAKTLLGSETNDPTPLHKHIWRGGMPGLIPFPDSAVADYFRAYVQTYVERDVLTLQNIRDMQSFDRFLGLMSALTGQEINASQLGREIGVSPKIARNWLNLLKTANQWWEVPAYHGNTIKRVSGKWKGYITDTGLGCWLQRLYSSETLIGAPQLGALFETMVIGSIRQQCLLLDMAPGLWHWRTRAGAEVDLILEYGGTFFPIEIKAKTNPNGHDARGIIAFRKTYPQLNIGPGLVVCACKESRWISENVMAVPWNLGLFDC
jgi:predicted AAA+ superfamily ATPase